MSFFDNVSTSAPSFFLPNSENAPEPSQQFTLPDTNAARKRRSASNDDELGLTQRTIEFHNNTSAEPKPLKKRVHFAEEEEISDHSSNSKLSREERKRARSLYPTKEQLENITEESQSDSSGSSIIEVDDSTSCQKNSQEDSLKFQTEQCDKSIGNDTHSLSDAPKQVFLIPKISIFSQNAKQRQNKRARIGSSNQEKPQHERKDNFNSTLRQSPIEVSKPSLQNQLVLEAEYEADKSQRIKTASVHNKLLENSGSLIQAEIVSFNNHLDIGNDHNANTLETVKKNRHEIVQKLKQLECLPLLLLLLLLLTKIYLCFNRLCLDDDAYQVPIQLFEIEAKLEAVR